MRTTARVLTITGGIVTLLAGAVLFASAFLGSAGGTLLLKGVLTFGLAALIFVAAGLLDRAPGRVAAALAGLALVIAIVDGWFALLSTPLLLCAALTAMLSRSRPPA